MKKIKKNNYYNFIIIILLMIVRILFIFKKQKHIFSFYLFYKHFTSILSYVKKNYFAYIGWCRGKNV